MYGVGGAWQVEGGLIMHHDLPTPGDFARLHYTSTCNSIFYISLHHAGADRQIMLPTLERSVLLMQLHYGPSNEIKEIEVCKKCPKVKPYCVPIFDPIMVKPFLDDAKLPKFCTKYVSLSKQSNIGCIFWICL